jgi:hypothetical protein
MSKKDLKKITIQDSIGKTNLFFVTLPFIPCAVLAMWLHVGTPQKYKKNKFKTHFEQKNSPRAHMEL